MEVITSLEEQKDNMIIKMMIHQRTWILEETSDMIGEGILLTCLNNSQRRENLTILKRIIKGTNLVDKDEELRRKIPLKTRIMDKHPNLTRTTSNLSSAKFATKRDMTVYSTVQSFQNSFPEEQM